MSLSARNLNILGVTGSIGQSVLDVLRANPGRFKVQVVTAFSQPEALAQAAMEAKANHAVIADESHLPALKKALAGSGVTASGGEKSLLEAAALNSDITVAAIMGFAGLAPLLSAIENSQIVAIANKEPLVAAGRLVLQTAKVHGTKLLPLDSEHNAVFQVFDAERPQGIARIILTASGGPFRDWPYERMRSASLAEALKHPNWQMGQKITIDSATMMNKALEVIEAHYLFGLPPEQIDVLVHPQSIVHSMVEYVDGSVLAQLSGPDMRTPIAHALGWPERLEAPVQRLNFSQLSDLTFAAPDLARFPGLNLAYRALKLGPKACLALNAVNEVAVQAFLAQEIGFTDIASCNEQILHAIESGHFPPEFDRLKDDTLEGINSLDALVREETKTYIAETFQRKAFGSP
jgi:1-deoxy-D-xylulose-5-phosphate reductoisomerase